MMIYNGIYRNDLLNMESILLIILSPKVEMKPMINIVNKTIAQSSII